jgi:hypothetical protein
MHTPTLRLVLTGSLLAVAMLFSSPAKADCGGCGGKKECPSPSPTPAK